VGTAFNVDDLFINPRFGINYKFTTELNSYFSFARVTREPRLKNYYDAGESSGGAVPQFEKDSGGNFIFENPLVKPESMNSFELGTTFSSKDLKLNANLFYMIFNNEIVKQGQVDRFGQPTTGNADRTIHSGIELSGDLKFLNYFQLIVNGSYSQNYISEGDQFISYEDPNTNEEVITALNLKDNKISGFPEITFNAILNFNYKGFRTKVLTKYVGEFYSDNFDENLEEYLNQYPGFTDYSDNKIESYFTANLFTSYEFPLEPFFNKIKIYAQVNNLFDKLYAAYAIGKEFFPAAERNYLAGIKVGL
jgi:iron complex outermembrane receptor protein